MKAKENIKEQSLFTYPQLRTRDGRYCTKEQYRREKVDGENQRLKYKCDKYYRAWIAAANKANRLERELKHLHEWIRTSVFS